MKRLRALSLVLLLLVAGRCFGQGVYEEQLDRGIRNNEPYSHLLVKRAHGDRQLLSEAVKHSPDTPAFYFARAVAGLPNIFEAAGFAAEGIKAYGKDFRRALSLMSLLALSLLGAFAFAMLMTVLLRLPAAIPLIRHDIEEDRRKLLVVLAVIPVSLLGPVFFMAGGLILAGFYFRKADKAVVYLALSLILLSPLYISVLDIMLSASSPKVRAVVSVSEARGNAFAIETLKDEKGFAPELSHAIALKREGRYEEALEKLRRIPGNDPRAYTNMGNAFVGLGNMALAKESYQKSIGMKESATALYNLSKVLPDTLEFEESKEVYRKAQALDGALIQKLSVTESRSPNRFVADETLTFSELWDYTAKNAVATVRPFTASPIAASSVSAVCLFLFALLGRRLGAKRCSRCGAVFCRKCSPGIRRADMCPACYSSFLKPSGETPKERVAKLLSLHERKTRMRRTVRALSFFLPGIAHIYAGKALSGFLYLWAFGFAAVGLVLNIQAPVYSHGWLNPLFIVMAGMLYLGSILVVQGRLKRGWL